MLNELDQGKQDIGRFVDWSPDVLADNQKEQKQVFWCALEK